MIRGLGLSILSCEIRYFLLPELLCSNTKTFNSLLRDQRAYRIRLLYLTHHLSILSCEIRVYWDDFQLPPHLFLSILSCEISGEFDMVALVEKVFQFSLARSVEICYPLWLFLRRPSFNSLLRDQEVPTLDELRLTPEKLSILSCEISSWEGTPPRTSLQLSILSCEISNVSEPGLLQQVFHFQFSLARSDKPPSRPRLTHHKLSILSCEIRTQQCYLLLQPYYPLSILSCEIRRRRCTCRGYDWELNFQFSLARSVKDLHPSGDRQAALSILSCEIR